MRVNGFTDLGTRKAASESTHAGVFYDDANVYVAFKVEQSSPIVASPSVGRAARSPVVIASPRFDRRVNGRRLYGRDCPRPGCCTHRPFSPFPRVACAT